MDGIEVERRRSGTQREARASGFGDSGRRKMKRQIVRESREARCGEATESRERHGVQRERIEPMAHGAAEWSSRRQEGGSSRVRLRAGTGVARRRHHER